MLRNLFGSNMTEIRLLYVFFLLSGKVTLFESCVCEFFSQCKIEQCKLSAECFWLLEAVLIWTPDLSLNILFLISNTPPPPLLWIERHYIELPETPTKQIANVNCIDSPCLTSFHLTGCIWPSSEGLGGHSVASLTMTALKDDFMLRYFFPLLNDSWHMTLGSRGECTLPLRLTYLLFCLNKKRT